MFEALTEKLQATFRRLRSRGRLTEADVREALRDVRMALLEADVNFKVVKDFLARVEARAVGQEVLASLTPEQEVIRAVRDELIALLGERPERLKLAATPPTVIYLVGLQGSGKTTTAAKVARWLVNQGHRPLLVAADVTRPAAVDQLQRLAQTIGVAVWSQPESPAVEVVRGAYQRSRQVAADVIVVDTAGRLHIDPALMEELRRMEAVLPAHERLLVVDAMTGQDAVRVAETFAQAVPLTGFVLTKLDGDARGGAALSIRAVTGLPVKFMATGEKLDALEVFQPDRLASRILGMGDVLSLIERAEAALDRQDSERLAQRLDAGDFTLEEFKALIAQVKRMGPLSKLVDLLPQMGPLQKVKGQIDDRSLVRVEAILNSMTRAELRRPDIINGSRRRRIALGSGTTVQEVNRLLRQYEEMRKLMRQWKGMKKRNAKAPRFPLPPFPNL
ncbi:MAG: signal recognition particle protein [Firmicutes bacterium]|nr:signal recognition particle protein [Alicyclobacillaceae bacterium]MCL6496366.1 signal recognition particle protein [Bacillota bacterium]